ncbi:MAG: DUF1538 domain-containing protein [Lachnospiraceae bacterium]
MRINSQLKEKVTESIASVLPITAIVLLLSITLAPLHPGLFLMFLFGAILLIIGMGFFTLGADMAMIPMGEGIGVVMSHSKKIVRLLVVFFVLGVLVTIAEPDLQVLAEQVPSIPNMVLVWTVAAGVGVFLVISELRILFRIPLSYTLIFFYGLIFLLAFFTPDTFVPVSFDAGGVTTGPITVPFLMALGIGLASVRSDKNSSDDSFGLIALCSIGPILAVQLLGIFYQPGESAYTQTVIVEAADTKEAAAYFFMEFPEYAKEVATSLLPIFLVFAVFELMFRRFRFHQLLKILFGLLYTYIGLVLFLTGVNVGFMPVGQYIGQTLASGSYRWLLVPIGMVIGYCIVRAEPAVQVLVKQVEEVSNGSIAQKTMRKALSIGIALAVGLAMLRILAGIPLLYFLIPGYAVSLIMTFFVPQMFTGIAFDSGGVASGAMTSTFLLPFAMGACEAVGGNILTDAFGIVAMVAMTPLCTIQLLGLGDRVKAGIQKKRLAENQIMLAEDCIVYFD